MKEYRAVDVMETEKLFEKLNLNVGSAGAKKLTGEIIFVRLKTEKMLKNQSLLITNIL